LLANEERMPEETLSFTVKQTTALRDIDFPLHPQTVSAAHVGSLLEAVLDAISGQISQQGKVSDGDLLQSLCMALAVRMHMVDSPPDAVRHLVAATLEQAETAVANSVIRPTGNA
jgi:hypothetical protein